MTDPTDLLERDLLDLAHALEVDEPSPELADVVLARVTAAAPLVERGRRPWATRPAGRGRRALVAALVAVVALTLVPPVRAAVVELLRIGGVEIGRTPAPPPSTAPTRPTGEGLGSLDDARRQVDFPVLTATSLGPPDRVALLEGGEVVAQTWGSGSAARHLDAFDGTLDWGYLKTVWGDVQVVEVGGRDAVWLSASHLTQWVDRSGGMRSAAPRLAGPTLVWTVAGDAGRDVTYRLEGVADLTTALEVARSVR